MKSLMANCFDARQRIKVRISEIAVFVSTCLLAMLAMAGCATADSIEDRIAIELAELGFEYRELPPLTKPFGTYELDVRVDKSVFLTSAASKRPNGKWVKGIVPTDITLDEAIGASKLSCISMLSRLNHAAGGDMKKIRRLARITYLTAATETFSDLDKIASACSDMLIRVLGKEVVGQMYTSAAVPVLPWNLLIEVEMEAILW